MTTPEGATPVARGGAPARAVAHRIASAVYGADEWCHPNRARAAHPPHSRDCDRLTEAIEADRASRDASAEEVERVLVAALQPFAVAETEPNRCGSCHWLLEKCIDENCRGFHARAALARVASLRGGTGR